MRKKNTVSYKLGPEQHLPLTKAQGAELKGLTSMSEDQIDTSDIPPLPEAFWQTAVRNPFYRPIKQQLTVRLEVDVLTWLRSAGRGYQTKLNAILREAMVREVTQQAPPDSRASRHGPVPLTTKRGPRPDLAKSPAVPNGSPCAFSNDFLFL